MRYLNKITFINSASIKYAEVSLDGNAHFIGTQGVGKSTLLRAILFFYNADKTKLGIPREQKNFDEYYFPFQNSYIVYEIVKEDTAFSILAFKTQGRVAFRFIDAPYTKDFFIDEQGSAFDSWDKMRAILPKEVDFTRTINFYEDYKNILYGNNAGLTPEFKKYAVLESKQFQNIPRTIQNVFLNSKLDAGFIKETIIKSLNEEENIIDLDTYSHNHLKDFEIQINDIKKWSNKNKKGDLLVIKQADAVASFLREYSFLLKEKTELANELAYTLKEEKELLPQSIKCLKTAEQTREDLKIQQATASKLFDEKKQTIDRQIGVCVNNLETINTKQLEYKKIDIESLLARLALKESMEITIKRLDEEAQALSSTFSDLKLKYEALTSLNKNQFETFVNKQNTDKNALKEEFFALKEELNIRYRTLNDKISAEDKVELDIAIEALEKCKAELRDSELKLSENKHKRFCEKEIEDCKANNLILEQDKRNAQNTISQSTEKIKNIEREWQLELSKIEHDFEKDIHKQASQKEALELKISSINDKLECSKDSLYAWLNINVPFWNFNIGKLIDEENVLFKTGLNPTLSEGDNSSFYGVNIELEAINKSVKTLDDYKSELTSHSSAIVDVNKSIASLENINEENVKKLKRKFSTKITELKELVSEAEFVLLKSNDKILASKVLLEELVAKAQNEKKNLISSVENEISKTKLDVAKAKESLEAIRKATDEKMKTSLLEMDSLLAKHKKDLEDKLLDFDRALISQRQDFDERANVLDAKRKSEIEDKGIDTKRLNEIDVERKKAVDELTFIEKNATLVAEFNKDKRELFDKLDDFKREKILLDKSLEREILLFKEMKETSSAQIKLLNKETSRLAEQIRAIEADFKKYEAFTKSDVYASLRINLDSKQVIMQSDKSASDLIEMLTQAFYKESRTFVDLQSAINKFTGNFDENNIFNFKIKFATNQDYIDFANELREFIDEDKISEYEKRVNERFAHIVAQIARETSALVSKEGEIQAVINMINKDFQSKNFVGAIKSMEMRTIPSSNKIMRLLIEIKNYNEINGLELGNANLFSDGNLIERNEKAVNLIKQLVAEMHVYKASTISLSDSFGLEFRIAENDNDTGWVERLSNVGSEGTDVLVKAMINIMLLNVFKNNSSKKFDDFKLHCMMDEIGKLHPTNVKGILKFANDRNILLINGSPTSLNASDYKYTFILSKDSKNVTTVRRLVKKISAN